MRKIWTLSLLTVLAPHLTWASSGHGSATTQILPFLIVILIAAKIGGAIFEKIKQPVVLGELIFGVLLGNIAYFSGGSVQFFEQIKEESFIKIFSEIGIIILLFQVGLSTKLKAMLRVGVSSLCVATIGVIFPFLVGYFASQLLGWGSSSLVNIYIGATLVATSVGITARVLQDINKIDLNESRIILGAAVIDDVIGLVILSLLSGLAGAAATGSTSTISVWDVSVIISKAVGFLVIAIFLGNRLAPHILNATKYLKVEGMNLVMALLFAFSLAYVSELIGLHAIVGAFAAGLILEEAHFEGFYHHHNLDTIMRPISNFFVPVFFVLIGMKVSLETLTNLNVLSIALIMSVIAIISKLAAGWGAIGKDVDRLSIGIGMIPRGEVGLIFASIGLEYNIIKGDLYSAAVVMVMITTLVTPPLLKWSLSRKEPSPA